MVAGGVLLGARLASAKDTETTIAVGTHLFVVPAAFLWRYDATSLSVAAVWPEMTGAMVQQRGTPIPPRSVLDISWSLRTPRSTFAEEGRRLQWQPWPHDGSERAFGLQRMKPGPRHSENNFLVDDTLNPTLVITYAKADTDPEDAWCRMAFETDDMRSTLLLFGALLPQWREIRTSVTKLYASFRTQ